MSRADPRQLRQQLGSAKGAHAIGATDGLHESIPSGCARSIDCSIPTRRARTVRVHPARRTSRTEIREYRLLNDEVDELVTDINTGTVLTAETVVLLRAHHSLTDVGSIGPPTSASCRRCTTDEPGRQEPVAARDDRSGVPILSPFTGAAREMPEALLVNLTPRMLRRRAEHGALMPQEAGAGCRGCAGS